MEHPGFFERKGPFTLGELCTRLELTCDTGADKTISDIKGLQDAGPGHITFMDDPKWQQALKDCKATVCITSEKYKDLVPEAVITLIANKPYDSFAALLPLYYPASMRSQTSLSTNSLIDETAVIEEGTIIEAGAVIGREAVIGAGTLIAAGSVIGYRTHIGRDCMVGPNAVVTHALIGNNVTIHAGVAIGQDGFGYIMGPGGHKKVPQIGRVIIQDQVEIGANSTVDRGALADTIIGEGTKIDNLVQIGHNVVIGCHAVIVAHTGIAGSVKLGNYVVMGGQSGARGHVKIGDGAQIAASSKVNGDIPPNVRYGGTPAKPIKKWFKEIIALERLAEGSIAKKVD